ncbi:uncharacterized protein UV8b_04426 [Ustilaginoidea virens]|uniref:SYO1-like TPR repeats domain-containing protein n=1 Tax=Ustilaginoidea virens TaxID=1159556 RepID=A0A8E5HR90_USTVR|nr:uncharacterized protein UV8b_04426 [Ustilaginoidea virens]QUC20185.1 hypothetical protein UV8b_04426 [Ustilaginoidea virens]
MGKSRRNRAGASQRRDPIAKPVKPPSDPELAALRETSILPVVNSLKNADPKSRTAAATAVSNLIHDSRCRKLLLREHIVHTVLTQTLTDAAPESRAAGWGILRVIAEHEEPDFCVHLYRSDVLTAVEHAVKSVGGALASSSSSSSSAHPGPAQLPLKAERALVVSVAASLVALLTALAEATDEALQAISASRAITDFLFRLVACGSRAGPDAAAAAAAGLSNLRGDALACLMILTEDNQPLARSVVSDPERYQALLEVKDEATGDGVLACATLHNVFAALGSLGDAPHVPGADDSSLIPTLAKVVARVQAGQGAADQSGGGGGSGGGWSSAVEQQQLALETLASIGTALLHADASSATPAGESETAEPKADEDMGDADGEAPAASDDDASDAEDDDEDDDDGMDQDELDADMDMVTGADDPRDDGNLDDMPVLKALLQTALPELLRIATFQPADDDSLRLQAHALSALNNIAWSVSLVDFSDDLNGGIQKAWLPVGHALWARVIAPTLASDTADISLATTVTSLAWAVSRTLGGQLPAPLEAADPPHRKFISLYQATRQLPEDTAAAAAAAADPFQRLGVKCVGVLGQLAMHPAPAPRNREIGAFLMALLAGLPDTPAPDAVEALMQVYDVYGDEQLPCDRDVFWRDGFLDRLEAAAPRVRAMVKGVDGKTQPELKARAAEALLNLERFVAYKKKNRPREDGS